MRRIVYALAAGTLAAFVATPVLAQTNAGSPSNPPSNPMMGSSGSMQPGPQAQAPNTPMTGSEAAKPSAQAPESPMASSGSASGTSIEAGGASGADLNTARLKAWDDFKNSNPSIAKQLKRNPKLIGKQAFIEKHPELKQLLEANAGLKEDMMKNPGNYMARSYGKSFARHHHHHHHAMKEATS